MKLDDYVRALTAALAVLPPQRVILPESSGVSLTPKHPGSVSLAGMTASGEVIGIDRWLAQLPGTVRDVRSWSCETLHSPRFTFVPADFVALMDAQAPREAVWERLFLLVRESAEMNGEPPVERAGIRDTLQNADDGWWGLMAEQLLQEAQIECLVEDAPFVVPEALTPLFVPGEALFPEEEEQFSVYLYNLRPVMVDELVKLVEAQGRAERLGPALAAEIAETFSDFAGQKVSDGLAWLKSRTDRDAEETSLSALVCRAVCRFCEEARENPVIPRELAEAFGPNERDQKRAQFRGTISGGAGCYPVLNAKPWSCYVWQAVGETAPAEASLPSAASTFRGVLVEIEAFARLHESPFAEAFRLALFALGLGAAPWDEAYETTVRTRLTGEGFSETAINVFNNNVGPVRELAALGWPHDRLAPVLAAAVADVFGGMGSWNDQDFGDHYEEYSRVSGALAESLRSLWQALLAPWGTRGLS